MEARNCKYNLLESADTLFGAKADRPAESWTAYQLATACCLHTEAPQSRR